MTAQRTPRAWVYVSDPYDDGTPYMKITAENGLDGEDYAWFQLSGIVEPADAKLIAAAPDLLEALQDLQDSGILGSAESNASGMPNWEFVSKRINAARAAIKKATS
jgi:hypothetical protein